MNLKIKDPRLLVNHNYVSLQFQWIQNENKHTKHQQPNKLITDILAVFQKLGYPD